MLEGSGSDPRASSKPNPHRSQRGQQAIALSTSTRNHYPLEMYRNVIVAGNVRFHIAEPAPQDASLFIEH